MKSAAYYIDAWRLIVDGKFWGPVMMAERAFQNGGSSSTILIKR
jgi:hypothetical protein